MFASMSILMVLCYPNCFLAAHVAATRPGLVWSERWTDELVVRWRQSYGLTGVADKLLAFTRFGLTRFHSERLVTSFECERIINLAVVGKRMHRVTK